MVLHETIQSVHKVRLEEQMQQNAPMEVKLLITILLKINFIFANFKKKINYKDLQLINHDQKKKDIIKKGNIY